MNIANYERGLFFIIVLVLLILNLTGGYQARSAGASTVLPDLHLKTTSPAIDNGQNLPAAGSSDINGQMRIQGSLIDIGADEVR